MASTCKIDVPIILTFTEKVALSFQGLASMPLGARSRLSSNPSVAANGSLANPYHCATTPAPLKVTDFHQAGNVSSLSVYLLSSSRISDCS